MSQPASEALKLPEGPPGMWGPGRCMLVAEKGSCGPLSLRLCWLFQRPEGQRGYQGDVVGTPLGPGERAAAAACLWHPDSVRTTPHWLRLRSRGVAYNGYNPWREHFLAPWPPFPDRMQIRGAQRKMKMLTNASEPQEVALCRPQLSPTDSEYQVLSQTWAHVPRPPSPTDAGSQAVGLGHVSPSPPPSTQAAASAQFPSSPTRVRAAVGPPEEILSFAQPPGTQGCLEQLGGGGGRGCWAAPRAGRAWTGVISEVGNRAGASSGTPASNPYPWVQGLTPATHRGDLGLGLCPPGVGATPLTGLPQATPCIWAGAVPPEWL